jgi:hypothetical protein
MGVKVPFDHLPAATRQRVSAATKAEPGSGPAIYRFSPTRAVAGALGTVSFFVIVGAIAVCWGISLKLGLYLLFLWFGPMIAWAIASAIDGSRRAALDGYYLFAGSLLRVSGSNVEIIEFAPGTHLVTRIEVRQSIEHRNGKRYLTKHNMTMLDVNIVEPSGMRRVIKCGQVPANFDVQRFNGQAFPRWCAARASNDTATMLSLDPLAEVLVTGQYAAGQSDRSAPLMNRAPLPLRLAPWAAYAFLLLAMPVLSLALHEDHPSNDPIERALREAEANGYAPRQTAAPVAPRMQSVPLSAVTARVTDEGLRRVIQVWFGRGTMLGISVVPDGVTVEEPAYLRSTVGRTALAYDDIDAATHVGAFVPGADFGPALALALRARVEAAGYYENAIADAPGSTAPTTLRVRVALTLRGNGQSYAVGSQVCSKVDVIARVTASIGDYTSTTIVRLPGPTDGDLAAAQDDPNDHGHRCAGRLSRYALERLAPRIAGAMLP